jgi:hypothetical protein
MPQTISADNTSDMIHEAYRKKANELNAEYRFFSSGDKEDPKDGDILKVVYIKMPTIMIACKMHDYMATERLSEAGNLGYPEMVLKDKSDQLDFAEEVGLRRSLGLMIKFVYPAKKN